MPKQPWTAKLLRCFLSAVVGSALLTNSAKAESTQTAVSSGPNFAPANAAAPEVAAPKPPWGRVVLVGASVSAGFTESEPFGGPKTPQYRLSRYLNAALRVPHEPVRSLANPMFFLNPDQEARKQLDQALKAKPTLVAGLDFLFWFCYGEGPSDADRARRFEQGLKLLEAVSCPLVLGDIPDASIALNTALSEEQIPSQAAILAANRRLKQWAAERPQVAIVPLSGIMRSVTANQALTVHAHTVVAGKSRHLVQSDRLHPSPSGCAILALSVLDSFVAGRPTLAASDVCWDPEEVLRAVAKTSPAASGSGARAPAAPAQH
jgi:hypothetical protein